MCKSNDREGSDSFICDKVSGHKSDLISRCQRCSSSISLFSTSLCFCFFSLLSCSFLARLLGLISTGSSGLTFFYRHTGQRTIKETWQNNHDTLVKYMSVKCRFCPLPRIFWAWWMSTVGWSQILVLVATQWQLSLKTGCQAACVQY